MYQDITYKVADPVATITLNRPKYANAWTTTMSREVRHALAQAERDPLVVGIIITGAGRAFCSGADISSIQTLTTGKSTSDISEETPQKVSLQLSEKPGDPLFPEGFREGLASMTSIRKPIIAAINGPCVGMAMSISLFCDFRFLSEDGYIKSAFSERGLVAEVSASWMLTRLVGLDRCLDILYASNKISAPEALEMGLVTKVFPADTLITESENYIKSLAQRCAPKSIALMKRQVFADLHRSMAEGNKETNELMATSHTSADLKEGMKAFMKKRPPNFERIS